METELIIITEYCDKCNIEPEFIILLENERLVNTQWVDGVQYLPASQLADIEKFARWYYDFSINIEGIDTIHRLLQKMRLMQQELNLLRKALNEDDNSSFIDLDDNDFL